MGDVFKGIGNFERVLRTVQAPISGRIHNQWVYIPRAQVVNEVQPPLEEIQRSTPAEGRYIPLAYGEVQLGGRIFAVAYKNEQWYVGYILCYGEIDSFVNVKLNGEAAKPGTAFEYYRGTATQDVSPNLAGNIPGYNDTLRVYHPTEGWFGIAYVVVRYSDVDYQDFPQLLATVKARKVWNPKTQTKVYSENPALHLGDFMRDKITGMGLNVSDASIEAAQDYNDEIVGGQIRRKSFYVVKELTDSPSIVEAMRLYASCFVLNDNNVYKLVPDKDGPAEMDITPEDIEEDSVNVEQRDISGIPTVISAYYTDKSQPVWRTRLCTPVKAAGVDAGTTPIRESKLRLDGITRHAQAVRECTERLNKMTLGNITVNWKQYASAQQLQKGSIVTFTSGMGFNKKPLRIVSCEENEPGIWSVSGEEHDPAFYSSVVVSEPTFDDVTVPLGIFPSAPGAAFASEELFTLKNGEIGSRLLITWTVPPRSFVTDYYIEVYTGGAVVWTGVSATLSITTGPLPENVTYSVRVYSRNSLYTSVSYATASATVDGDTDAPSAVGFLSGSVKDGAVYLSWPAISGARRYEVRYYTTGQSWSAGTVLERVDGLNLATREVPDGTWKFGVRAITSVGNYSNSTAELTMAVSSDTGGKTTYYQTTQPTGAKLNDDWFDLDDKNHHYYYNGSNWISLRDGTIADAAALAQQALDDASQALGIAQTVDLKVDGKVTTYLTASEPTVAQYPDLSEGDLWLKAAPPALSVYNTWRTNLNINYAIMFNNTVDDNGASGDAPSYGGTYADFALPNRPNGRGINQQYASNWANTDLDAVGGVHSVAFTVYIPSGLANGSYGLYSNGGSVSGQAIYIKANNGSFKLVITHADNSNAETISNNINLTAGANSIVVAFLAGPKCMAWVGGTKVLDKNTTYSFSNGTTDPEIGGDNASVPADGADNVSIINNSGIVIGDFLQADDFSTGTIPAEFYSQLFEAGSSGSVEQYRYSQANGWQLFKDSGISDAEAAAFAAQESADKKIITWYGVDDPSVNPGGFNETNDGDIWFDAGNQNRMKRWDHSQSTWIDVRDEGIQQGIDDASAALALAQVAEDTALAAADGAIVTFFQSTMPTDAESRLGDLWFKGAPISGGAYDAWRTSLGVEYAIKLDGAVDDNGTAQDAPAYSGGYSTAGQPSFPNRANGKGITDLWSTGWPNTALDNSGGNHSVAMGIYIPASLANGSYGLYENGGSSAAQCVYIYKNGAVLQLVAGHIHSGGAGESDKARVNITAGSHTIGVAWVGGSPDRIRVSVDGSEAANVTLTGSLTNGGSGPEIGGAGPAGVSAILANAPVNPITGSGIAISDFLQHKFADWSPGGTNLFSSFHNQFIASGGDVEQYRYDGTPGGWIRVRDVEISDAEAAALAAQATADKKIITWYGTSDPSIGNSFDINNDGDLWVDEGNGNVLKRWVHASQAWVSVRDTGIAEAAAAAAAAEDLANQALIGTESSPRASNFVCVKFKRYPINTASGSFTATLPTPPAVGDVVGFFDYNKSWHNYSFFIGPGASYKIEGRANGEQLECNLLGAAFMLQYTGSTKGWMII